jgi:ribonuclease inhibitor
LEIDLDGREIRSRKDFHEAMARVMDFGPYYGGTLDALWDRLSRDVERPVQLTWKHASVSRRALGEEYFRKVVEILSDVMHEDQELGRADRFEFQLVD